jgi:hypothetical protein
MLVATDPGTGVTGETVSAPYATASWLLLVLALLSSMLSAPPSSLLSSLLSRKTPT